MELLSLENPQSTLEHCPNLLPQITGDPNALTSAASLKTHQLIQNNTKMAAPLFVALDKTWTIKQCIDEICKYTGLVGYDALSKTSGGKVLYTLSPLSFPIAIFNQSVALETIVNQLQLDFDLETEMEQEGIFDKIRSLNAAGNGDDSKNDSMNDDDAHATTSPQQTTPPTSAASPSTQHQTASIKHKTKSATHRINTTLLPLHLAFGWYLDSPPQ